MNVVSTWIVLVDGSTIRKTTLHTMQHGENDVIRCDWFVMQEMMTADEAATSSQLAVARCKQVEYLQQQMVDLNLEQQLQGAKVNLADPHGTLQK